MVFDACPEVIRMAPAVVALNINATLLAVWMSLRGVDIC